MNKKSTINDAIEELEKTQSIEILDNLTDEEEYKKIIEHFKQTKSDFLTEMKGHGYSEFMSGVLLGMVLTEEGKRVKRRMWRPSFMRKE